MERTGKNVAIRFSRPGCGTRFLSVQKPLTPSRPRDPAANAGGWLVRYLGKRNGKPGRHRYATDPANRKREEDRKRHRYATNPQYREKIRERIRRTKRERYATDPLYRERIREGNRKRWATDPQFRGRERERNREWRARRNNLNGPGTKTNQPIAAAGGSVVSNQPKGETDYQERRRAIDGLKMQALATRLASDRARCAGTAQSWVPTGQLGVPYDEQPLAT